MTIIFCTPNRFQSVSINRWNHSFWRAHVFSAPAETASLWPPSKLSSDPKRIPSFPRTINHEPDQFFNSSRLAITNTISSHPMCAHMCVLVPVCVHFNIFITKVLLNSFTASRLVLHLWHTDWHRLLTCIASNWKYIYIQDVSSHFHKNAHTTSNRTRAHRKKSQISSSLKLRRAYIYGKL